MDVLLLGQNRKEEHMAKRKASRKTGVGRAVGGDGVVCKPVNFRIPLSYTNALKRYGIEHNVSPSIIVRSAMNAWLAQRELTMKKKELPPLNDDNDAGEPVSFRIPASFVKSMKAYGTRYNVTRSVIVRSAIKDWLISRDLLGQIEEISAEPPTETA